jgi:hypothetical protein
MKIRRRGRLKPWKYNYWSELATFENALLAFDPINRTVPTTRTRITANITAYSAMSCPPSSDQSPCISFNIVSSRPPSVPREEGLSLNLVHTSCTRAKALVNERFTIFEQQINARECPLDAVCAGQSWQPDLVFAGAVPELTPVRIAERGRVEVRGREWPLR